MPDGAADARVPAVNDCHRHVRYGRWARRALGAALLLAVAGTAATGSASATAAHHRSGDPSRPVIDRVARVPKRFLPARTATPSATPTMTLVIGTGWTPAETATLRSWIAPGSPEMAALAAVSGPPGHNETITIDHADTGQYAGEYFPGSGRAVLGGLDLDVLMHELNHATRDTWVLSNSVWEEGLARAGEVAEMNILAADGVPEAQTYWDLHHSYWYDMIYDELNNPGIAPGSGSIFNYAALALTRYQMAGYAFGKILIQKPRFLRRFDAALFTHPNGSLPAATLEAMAANIMPTVESRPFATWYAQQQIFNQHPPATCTLAQRQDAVFDFKCRGTDGSETAQAGRNVTVRYYDYANRLISTTTQVTRSLGWVAASWAGLPVGRVKAVATGTTTAGQIVTNTSYRPNISQAKPGVYGIVKNQLTGTVTLSSPTGRFASFTVPVSRGTFSAPSLQSFAGQVTVAFARGTHTVTRTVTKDAAPYAVNLKAS